MSGSQQLDPNLHVGIAMTVREWDIALNLMMDGGTYRIAAPIVQKMTGLIQQEVQRMQAEPPAPVQLHAVPQEPPVAS